MLRYGATEEQRGGGAAPPTAIPNLQGPSNQIGQAPTKGKPENYPEGGSFRHVQLLDNLVRAPWSYAYQCLISPMRQICGLASVTHRSLVQFISRFNLLR